MTKNILVIMKLAPLAPWSFDETNADLITTTNVEFIEYRSTNIGFSNDPPGYNGNVPSLNLNRMGAQRYGNVSNDGKIY